MQYHTWSLVPFDVPGGTDILDEIYTMLQLGCSHPRQGDQSGQSVNLKFSLSHTDPAGAHTLVTTGLKMQPKLSEQRVIKVKKPEVWYLLLTLLLSASMTGYELLIRIRHSCVTKQGYRVRGNAEDPRLKQHGGQIIPHAYGVVHLYKMATNPERNMWAPFKHSLGEFRSSHVISNLVG